MNKIIFNKYYIDLNNKLDWNFYTIYNGYEISNGKNISIFSIKKNILLIISKKYYFEQEIEYLKTFKHKNILKFYEILSDNEYYYIIREHFDIDLYSIISHSLYNINKQFIKNILTQINELINKLYIDNKIFFDLNPNNIFFIFPNKEDKNKFIIKIANLNPKLLNKNNLEYFTFPPPELFINKKFSEKSFVYNIGILLFNICYKQLKYIENFNYNNFLAQFNNNNNKFIKKNSKPKIYDDLDISNLLNKLLKEDDNERIDLNEYLSHNFFNIEETIKIKLITNLKNIKIIENKFIIKKIINLKSGNFLIITTEGTNKFYNENFEKEFSVKFDKSSICFIELHNSDLIYYSSEKKEIFFVEIFNKIINIYQKISFIEVKNIIELINKEIIINNISHLTILKKESINNLYQITCKIFPFSNEKFFDILEIKNYNKFYTVNIKDISNQFLRLYNSSTYSCFDNPLKLKTIFKNFIKIHDDLLLAGESNILCLIKISTNEIIKEITLNISAFQNLFLNMFTSKQINNKIESLHNLLDGTFISIETINNEHNNYGYTSVQQWIVNKDENDIISLGKREDMDNIKFKIIQLNNGTIITNGKGGILKIWN